MRNTYEITLVATDNGDPAQTTSATVQININDINEFTPQFTQSVYNISGLALNDTLPGVSCVYCILDVHESMQLQESTSGPVSPLRGINRT